MTTIEREGNIYKMTTFRPGKSVYLFIIAAMFFGAFNYIVYSLYSASWNGYILPILLVFLVVIFLFCCGVLFLFFGLSFLIPTTFILDEDGLWTSGLKKISLLCIWEEITNVSYDSYRQRYSRHRHYRFSPRIEIRTSRRLKKGPESYERGSGEPRSPTWERRNFYHLYIGEGALDPSDLRILYNEIRSQWMNRGIRYQIPDIRPAPYQIKRAEAS